MSRNTLDPFFVHHGIEASSCSPVTLDGKTYLLVGTARGKCSLCHLFSYKFVETIYEDSEQRRIVGVGSTIDSQISVHIRNHAIIFFRKYDKEWQITSNIPIEHYGFCTFSSQMHLFVFPDVEKTKNKIIVYESGNESRRYDLEKNLTPFCLAISPIDQTVYVGDEAGNLTSYKDGIIESKSLYTEPIFCLAITQSGLLAVGSSLPPIKCVKIVETGKSEDILEYHYRPDATGCSNIAFSNVEKTMIAGFWDGTIRGFSVKKREIILFLDAHKDTIINLLWLCSDNDNKTETRKDQMISCSRDGTLCFWRFPK